MFRYYIRLSGINLKRAPVLYGLVILTLAIGIGTFVANLAFINVMTSDPIPTKSQQLFHVSMNTWEEGTPWAQPHEVTRYADAKALLDAQIASHTAITYFQDSFARDHESTLPTRYAARMRITTRDFFAMMETPFAHGQGFSNDYAQEIVIGHDFNQKLFRGGNSVGKTVDVEGHLYRVVGVLAPWNVRPLFYHPRIGPFSGSEDLFIPLEAALDNNLSNGYQTISSDSREFMHEVREKNIYFLQTWVQLNTPEQVVALQQFMDNYARDLKNKGKHPNDIINELHNVTEWLEHEKVVDEKIMAFSLASILFLIVCIFNASSLLLAHYNGNHFEMGLKRAIGVSQKQLLSQGTVEGLLLGTIAAVCAMLLSAFFLLVIVHFMPNFQQIAVLEWDTIGMGILISLLTAWLCMAYPLLASSRQTISTQIKR